MLLTAWTRIGLSGATVDGRTITAEWLTQAAANYSLDKYTAGVNYEHYTFYPSMGTVHSLETRDEEDGKTGLYARINPTAELMYMNSQGRKMFTSMELNLDFADTGEAYLQGLAVTDTPASLGNQKLEFSADHNKQTFVSAAVEVGTFDVPDNTDVPGEAETSFMQKLGKTLGFSVTPKSKTTDHSAEDKDDMSKEMEALLAKFGAQLENIEARLPSTEEKKPGEGDDTEEHFSAKDGADLLAKFTALQEKHDALQEKFNDALKEKTPSGDGDQEQSEDDMAKCY